MTPVLLLTGLSILIISLLVFIIGLYSEKSITAITVDTNNSISNISIKNKSEFGVKILPPTNGVYHGANPGFGGTEDEVSAQKVITYEKATGKKLAWAYFSNNWINNITFPEKTVRTLDSLDIVPFIRMMPRTDFNQGSSDPVFTLQGIIDGKFDDSLIEWAKDAKETNIPIMVEFGTEVNGDWFPWSGSINGGGETEEYGDPKIADGPERFRDAYRHIIELFRTEGVNNITWVFHVIPSHGLDATISDPESWNKVKDYYPGDDYIDWIGTSIYGSTEPGKEWRSFTDIMDKAYKELESISSTKPFAILELGIIEDSEIGNKSEWMENALKSIESETYPRIKGISYWNEKWEDGNKTIDLTIGSSLQVEQIYKSLISSPFFVSTVQYEYSTSF